MKNYQRAIRYATKLIKDYNAPYNPRDLVHDSYVQWNKYTGSNLFEDADEKAMIKTIKNFHFNNLDKQYYLHNGEKRKREWYIINDDTNKQKFKEDPPEINVKGHTPTHNLTGERLLISKENIKDLRDGLCEFDQKVLDLKVRGYSNGEICEKLREEAPIERGKKNRKLKVHNGKITNSIKNIKKVMHTKSPFNGSKLVITKRVKRKDFEANKEKYLEDWEMGELSDYNEYYVQLTSKTNPEEGLLIKEKGSD